MDRGITVSVNSGYRPLSEVSCTLAYFGRNFLMFLLSTIKTGNAPQQGRLGMVDFPFAAVILGGKINDSA
jgi:hypothetical protein